MREFFKKKGVIAGIIALVLALAIATSAYLLGGRAFFLRDWMSALAQPLRSGVSAIAGELEHVYGYMHDYDTLLAENQALEERVAELENLLRDAQSALEENDRYRELLGLKERHPEFQLAEGAVTAWGASNWSSTFTINLGENDGLAIGDCVITETGYLAGQVIELGGTWATVRTVIDPDFACGVLLEDSGVAAIAQGEFSQMQNGCLQLAYIPDGAQVSTGEAIITSGQGGVVPSDLVVGYVSTVAQDAAGLTETAVLVPAVDYGDLSQIFVITDFATAS